MAAKTKPLRAKLDPSDVTIIVDTREQNPLDLSPLQACVGTLATGDYAIQGMERAARIERKSLDDLLACCGRERDRFEREIDRMMAFPVRVLLVEASWETIEIGQWRSQLSPKQVEGSLVGWITRGLQVELVGDHVRAGRFAAKLLYTVARRRYEELRGVFAKPATGNPIATCVSPEILMKVTGAS